MKDKVTYSSSGSDIRIDAIPTATKPPSVVDWKIIPQPGQKAVNRFIRRDGSGKIYMSFGAILKDFSRDDLIKLYRLVIKKYGANRPEEMYDRVLWGDLKTMFDPPLSDDAIRSWPLQQKMVNWSWDKMVWNMMGFLVAVKLATPEQMATGKEVSNPLIADSLLKTIRFKIYSVRDPTQNKVVIGYKNPLCLTRAQQVQPALYNGHEIIKTNHVPTIVHNSEDTLEIAEITRKKMNDKMKDPECVKKKMKAEAVKEHTTASRPIKVDGVSFKYTCNACPQGLTEGERGFEQTKECYLTEVIPFFKTLKEHFEGIQKALTKEIKEMKDIFEELEAEVDQNVVNRKHDEIERKNILIANDNLIADCLSKEVFYIATNSELTVSRFTEMHEAHTIVQTRCLELKAELSKLRDKVQKDDHTELVKRFSNLEVNHLNLQLKYQNLKESFRNDPSPPARDTPDFDNAMGHITQLTEKVTFLQEQNKLFRAENEKVKQHYKDLYDSIEITRAKHIEQTTALLTKNENLKAHENLQCNTMESVKPRVLAPGRYAIDVEQIPPHNRNNWEVHLHYLKHLKESVETLGEIVEEAKVERPLDRSIIYACCYTKRSQELLEYAIGTCTKAFNQRDKNMLLPL
ncbi:hypothetical protein Tco_0237962 [Tanacetum coccineum]